MTRVTCRGKFDLELFIFLPSTKAFLSHKDLHFLLQPILVSNTVSLPLITNVNVYLTCVASLAC